MDVDRLVELAISPKWAAHPGDPGAWLLPTKGDTTAQWAAPLVLADEIVPGLTLNISVPFARMGEFDSFVARMDYRWAGYVWHVGRIEFCPLGAPVHHRNSHLSLMRAGFPPTITGPHAHLAADNALLGIDAFRPTGNLPAAREIDWMAGFRNAISTVGTLFCLEGLWCGEALPWDRQLF